MSSVAILWLFAVFGGICGLYVSLIGFAITSIGICLLVGLVSTFAGGPFTPLLLLGAFIAQQVGYSLAVVGRGIALHVWRLRMHPRENAAKAELHADRDQFL